jgi:G3E family GTPase
MLPSPLKRDTTFTIHRTKGLIPTTDGKTQMLQGVREVFELVDLEQASSEKAKTGKIVFIGRGIGGLDFEGSLARALREVGD